MSEQDAIEAVAVPLTRASLVQDLQALGLADGDVVLTHTSLSRLGFVVGGAQAVVEALLETLGPQGTLVVPSQTSANSDPEPWEMPPVPEAWWPTIRDQMPAYDPQRTPSRGMGAVAELARTWPGAKRSNHPQLSFAAIGPQADHILEPHNLEDGFGEGSPLARLEQLGAKVLLLGAAFDSCTAFHLAEHRADRLTYRPNGTAVLVGKTRQWISFNQPDYDADDFEACGAALQVSRQTKTHQVGGARCELFELRAGVAFATGWLRDNRPSPGG